MNAVRVTGFLLVTLWMICVVLSVPAQSGGGFELTWSTVEGGGATFSTGGGYTVGGTIGQMDAGVLQGGSYLLAGGFWIGGMSRSAVYLPLMVR
ncbi:MAG: hypothetical protein N3D16_09510 [Anaerolineales bacterium]|nr:hypothetical protein [Anaerolineales bacterium]